jgi:putative component of membrane protein insertase Oxa1/YidC/SpoIIIJ protein YidD
MCSAGKIAETCEEYGFQLVNEEGVWKTGDALLMNMNR